MRGQPARELRTVTGTEFIQANPHEEQVARYTQGVCPDTFVCQDTFLYYVAQRLSSRDAVQQTVLPTSEPITNPRRLGLWRAEQRSFCRVPSRHHESASLQNQGTAGHLGLFGALGPSCPQAALGRDIFPRPLGKTSI